MKKIRPHLNVVCSTDELRPTIEKIHFINGYAYATNSFVMVKVPLYRLMIDNNETLNGHCIKASKYKMFLQDKHLEAQEDGIMSPLLGVKYLYDDNPGETIPDFESVLPNKKMPMKIDNIGISLNSLNKIEKALMHYESFVFFFYGKEKNVVIIPNSPEYCDQLALIAPLPIKNIIY